MCTKVEDCDGPDYRRGECVKHYRRMNKYGTYSDEALSKRGPKPNPTKPRSRHGVDRMMETAEGRAELGIPYERRPRNRAYVESGALHNETHCINGHEYTSENTYVYPEGSHNAGKKVCKICRRNAGQKYHGRPVSGDAPIGTWNRAKTHCAKGHPYDEENTRYTVDGARACKKCTVNNQRWYNYKLTPEQYQTMWDVQNGACWICNTPFQTDAHAHVDHDHVTGKVRALLCTNCNTGLGHFRENAEYINKAIAYIELHRDIAALEDDACITPQDFIGEPTQ